MNIFLTAAKIILPKTIISIERKYYSKKNILTPTFFLENIFCKIFSANLKIMLKNLFCGASPSCEVEKFIFV